MFTLAKPTAEQLEKVNQLTRTNVDEDQVYVFTSLSADTLPVSRRSIFGEFNIFFSNQMLDKLKKDYQTGVGLLASHDNNRLPFGRTFDANVKMDMVDGESVQTLYIDHYVVTHVKDEDGEKQPLRTEINGMTTQDIVNHIDVGHTFDTSIGFSIEEPLCSICENDLRDWEQCRHIPGFEYDVETDNGTEQKRCDIVANYGEGLENSVVYAGAVDRAIIQNNNYSKTSDENSENLQQSVNSEDSGFYNVSEMKSVPLDSHIFCRMSKGGGMELFTDSPNRRNLDDLKGREETMADNTQETQLQETVLKTDYDKVVSDQESLKTEFNEMKSAKEDFETKYNDTLTELQELQTKVSEEYKPKAEMADQFTEDLIQETLSAGVKARGNAFNSERFEKYLRSLEVSEMKEELSALQNEFPGQVEAARVSAQETETERDEDTVEMSKAEMRQEASKTAFQRYQNEGGDLEQLTKEEFSKLQNQSK